MATLRPCCRLSLISLCSPVDGRVIRATLACRRCATVSFCRTVPHPAEVDGLSASRIQKPRLTILKQVFKSRPCAPYQRSLTSPFRLKIGPILVKLSPVAPFIRRNADMPAGAGITRITRSPGDSSQRAPMVAGMLLRIEVPQPRTGLSPASAQTAWPMVGGQVCLSRPFSLLLNH